jgi:hypothetical protein
MLGCFFDWRIALRPAFRYFAKFRLMLNADGELTGVANESDVAPKLQSMLNLVIDDIRKTAPAEQRAAILELVGRVLSPSALIASATREAQIYFGLNGVELAPGEAVEVELDQPNPLGGGTIPTTFRVHLESATPDTAILRTITTYDASTLVPTVVALAQQAGKPVPPEELAKMPAMTMGDEATYVFDRTVGLMREVIVARRIAADDARRFDGWEIRLLGGPVR